MVISLLEIADKAKIVPCTTRTDVHYCFTSNLLLRHWAQGNGCPCLDSEGRAITFNNMHHENPKEGHQLQWWRSWSSTHYMPSGCRITTDPSGDWPYPA